MTSRRTVCWSVRLSRGPSCRQSRFCRESCRLTTLLTTIQALALRLCFKWLLSAQVVCFYCSVQSAPKRRSTRLEWSFLKCIRMFLCSTLPVRGGRHVQRCLSVFVCENYVQIMFRVPETGLEVNLYENHSAVSRLFTVTDASNVLSQCHIKIENISSIFNAAGQLPSSSSPFKSNIEQSLLWWNCVKRMNIWLKTG